MPYYPPRGVFDTWTPPDGSGLVQGRLGVFRTAATWAVEVQAQFNGDGITAWGDSAAGRGVEWFLADVATNASGGLHLQGVATGGDNPTIGETHIYGDCPSNRLFFGVSDAGIGTVEPRLMLAALAVDLFAFRPLLSGEVDLGQATDTFRDIHAGRNIMRGGLFQDTLYAYKTADESVSSSTVLQNDDHLTLSLEASARYAFEFELYTNNVAAAEGIRLALGGTVGVTSLKAQISIWNETTNVLAAFARVTAFASVVGVATPTGVGYDTIKGTIETSTAGTFLLQWAQQVSGASATTVQRNSLLRVKRIG